MLREHGGDFSLSLIRCEPERAAGAEVVPPALSSLEAPAPMYDYRGVTVGSQVELHDLRNAEVRAPLRAGPVGWRGEAGARRGKARARSGLDGAVLALDGGTRHIATHACGTRQKFTVRRSSESVAVHSI